MIAILATAMWVAYIFTDRSIFLIIELVLVTGMVYHIITTDELY